jgi:hypothetical protein
MLKYKKSSEQGNVFIELALVMPILILLVAGIIQFGFILNAKVAVNSASYEAARAATLSDKPELDAANSALSYAYSTLPGWSFDERLSLKVDVSGTDPGDIVQVEVIYKVPVFFSKISPFSMFEDGYAEVCGSSAMSIEEKE